MGNAAIQKVVCVRLGGDGDLYNKNAGFQHDFMNKAYQSGRTALGSPKADQLMGRGGQGCAREMKNQGR